jgi:hypothetical protein
MYNPINKPATFRVYLKDGKIKFSGTDKPSFFNTIEEAIESADFEEGDTVHEYSLEFQQPFGEIMVNKDYLKGQAGTQHFTKTRMSSLRLRTDLIQDEIKKAGAQLDQLNSTTDKNQFRELLTKFELTVKEVARLTYEIDYFQSLPY